MMVGIYVDLSDTGWRVHLWNIFIHLAWSCFMGAAIGIGADTGSGGVFTDWNSGINRTGRITFGFVVVFGLLVNLRIYDGDVTVPLDLFLVW